jgi:hypothetical protein
MLANTRYVLDAGMRGDLLKLRVALAPCVVGYAEIAAQLATRSDARVECVLGVIGIVPVGIGAALFYADWLPVGAQVIGLLLTYTATWYGPRLACMNNYSLLADDPSTLDRLFIFAWTERLTEHRVNIRSTLKLFPAEETSHDTYDEIRVMRHRACCLCDPSTRGRKILRGARYRLEGVLHRRTEANRSDDEAGRYGAQVPSQGRKGNEGRQDVRHQLGPRLSLIPDGVPVSSPGLFLLVSRCP